MMSGWMNAWMFLGFVFLVLLIALMIAALVWLVRSLTRPGDDMKRSSDGASEELDVAYARGQLSRDDYLQRRADLGDAPRRRTGQR